jgi:hypothetical protein
MMMMILITIVKDFRVFQAYVVALRAGLSVLTTIRPTVAIITLLSCRIIACYN